MCSKKKETVFSSLLFENENSCLIDYVAIFPSLGGYMFLAIAFKYEIFFCYFVIVPMPN